TNSQPAEVVVPAIGAFNDPPSRFLSANGPGQRGLPPTSYVGRDVPFACFPLRLCVVVSLIEADVVGSATTTSLGNHDSIERLASHGHVMDVGTGQRHAERDAVSVGEHMALGTEFRTIGRIGPGEFPPFGAFTDALSRDAHAQSMPLTSS